MANHRAPTRYVALLRGVNVGGGTRIGMADLRRLFAELGHTDVTTYLQSGNVAFTGAGDEPTHLAGEIERRIAADLGLDVHVLLRTGADLDAVVAGNPFLDRETDLTKLLVTFLAAPPTPDLAGQVAAPAGETAEFRLAGQEVYLHCPDGYGRTKLNNAFFERRLAVAATTRNWKTVTALHGLLTG
jgi:uncharacterized protein (DUF1697 family)